MFQGIKIYFIYLFINNINKNLNFSFDFQQMGASYSEVNSLHFTDNGAETLEDEDNNP